MVEAVLWRSCVSSFAWQDERSKKKKKARKKMLTATSCQDSVTWEGETTLHLVKLLRN